MYQTMTLNDGTFIYSEFTLVEYLKSLGFDMDILKEILLDDMIEEVRKDINEELHEEYERMTDGYFCAARDLAVEIDNLCEEFRKKYKAAAVHKVLDAIEQCVDTNRVD